MRILNKIRTYGLAATIGAVTLATPMRAQTSHSPYNDYFIKINAPAQGTDNPDILSFAPSPELAVVGEKKSARIVVDISRNILFKYDANGKPVAAYSVASGAKTGKNSSLTETGIYIIRQIQHKPYLDAPRGSKRRTMPNAFGPHILRLEIVNPKNGTSYDNGIYIHGNNNAASIGEYVSHGCIRMDNDIITEFANEASPGWYVIIKR